MITGKIITSIDSWLYLEKIHRRYQSFILNTLLIIIKCTILINVHGLCLLHYQLRLGVVIKIFKMADQRMID